MSADAQAMTSGEIRVTTMERGFRMFAVLVFGGCALLFAGLAYFKPTHGHELGYVMAVSFAWFALWAALRPEYAVIADESGFEYADERWAWLFMPRMRRGVWSDVTRVDTRIVQTKYGHFLKTRVWVRDLESSSGTHSFSVRSKVPHYHAFIDMLAARIASQPVEMTGFGLDTQRALRQYRAGRGKRAALAVVALIVFALVLIGRILTRR